MMNVDVHLLPDEPAMEDTVQQVEEHPRKRFKGARMLGEQVCRPLCLTEDSCSVYLRFPE